MSEITFFFGVNLYGADLEGICTGTWTPAEPAVESWKNGSTCPATPAEFEPSEITITDIAAQKLLEPMILPSKDLWDFWNDYRDELTKAAEATING